MITYSNTKSNAPDNTMIVVFIVNKKTLILPCFPVEKKRKQGRVMNAGENKFIMKSLEGRT